MSACQEPISHSTCASSRRRLSKGQPRARQSSIPKSLASLSISRFCCTTLLTVFLDSSNLSGRLSQLSVFVFFVYYHSLPAIPRFHFAWPLRIFHSSVFCMANLQLPSVPNLYPTSLQFPSQVSSNYGLSLIIIGLSSARAFCLKKASLQGGYFAQHQVANLLTLPAWRPPVAPSWP